MNSFTSIFKTLFRIGIGFACLIMVAEIVLQCLPVKTGFKRPAEITSGHPPHWQLNQSFTYSSGWRMDNPRVGWINNKGYPSPHDFIDDEQATIVIGDSFIENQMNAWDETFMGRLHTDTLPVYSFGLSGANIADYIGLAQHTSHTYKPQHMIIMLADGDITSARSAYQSGHYFIQDDELKQKPYSHKNAKLRNFFKQSALIRYVMMNLQLQRKLDFRIDDTVQKKTEKPDVSPYYKFFINEICALSRTHNFKTTLLVFNKELNRNIFEKETRRCLRINWVNAFDLIDNLKAENLNIRLDYQPYDGHWNATMHGHVYDALKEKLPF